MAQRHGFPDAARWQVTVLFGHLSARERDHLTRLNRSWRALRRLAGRPYEGPRMARAWQEVEYLHQWSELSDLSLAEWLVLTGSLVPNETAGRSTIDLGALPLVTGLVLFLGVLLLVVGQFGATLSAQASATWTALLDSSQSPSTARAPAQAPLVLPTATSTPTRTPTPTPTAPAQTPASAEVTASPSPTPTPTATPAGRRATAVIDGVIRSQPHQSAPRVGRLPAGAVVEAIQVTRGGAPFPPEDRWIEIRMGELHGYVYWTLLDLPGG